MSTKPKAGRQRAIKYRGQPAPRWHEFFLAAAKRLAKKHGNGAGDGFAEFPIMVAAEIVTHGDGAAFLMAARRGRPTQRQNLRWQLLREVERLTVDAPERRRPDTNTPDALALAPLVLELTSPHYFEDNKPCGYCGREIGTPHKPFCRQ